MLPSPVPGSSDNADLLAELGAVHAGLEHSWFDLRAEALHAANRWEYGRGVATDDWTPHIREWSNMSRLRRSPTQVEAQDGYAKAWDQAGRLVLIQTTPAERWMRQEQVFVHDPARGIATGHVISTVPHERWISAATGAVQRFQWRDGRLAFQFSVGLADGEPKRLKWSRIDFTWRDGRLATATRRNADGILSETDFAYDNKGLASISSVWPATSRGRHTLTQVDFLRRDLRPRLDAAWGKAEAAVLPEVWRAASRLAAGRPVHHVALVYGSGTAAGSLPPSVFIDVVGGLAPARHLFPEYGLHEALDALPCAAACADLNLLDCSRPGMLSRQFCVALARQMNQARPAPGPDAPVCAADFLAYASDPEGAHLRTNLARIGGQGR